MKLLRHVLTIMNTYHRTVNCYFVQLTDQLQHGIFPGFSISWMRFDYQSCLSPYIVNFLHALYSKLWYCIVFNFVLSPIRLIIKQQFQRTKCSISLSLRTFVFQLNSSEVFCSWIFVPWLAWYCHFAMLYQMKSNWILLMNQIGYFWWYYK